jgi:hypothetical protein
MVRLIGGTALVLALGTAVLLPAWGQPAASSRGPAGMTGAGSTAAQTAGTAAAATSRTAMGGMTMGDDTALARQLVAARLATAKYATNLARAKADGYQIITKLMPGMGFHFLNMRIQNFDVRKPQILVYEHHGSTWQLGALEWVFPAMPKTEPLPDATFGTFPAACHYADGTFVPHANGKTCAKTAPGTGAKFTFWHPDLFTMHVWIWYPNPNGLYASTNPLVVPFGG